MFTVFHIIIAVLLVVILVTFLKLFKSQVQSYTEAIKEITEIKDFISYLLSQSQVKAGVPIDEILREKYQIFVFHMISDKYKVQSDSSLPENVCLKVNGAELLYNSKINKDVLHVAFSYLLNTPSMKEVTFSDIYADTDLAKDAVLFLMPTLDDPIISMIKSKVLLSSIYGVPVDLVEKYVETKF